MKLSSLSCDMIENGKNRLKSLEKTISISVILILLQCIWNSTEKN